MAHTRTPTFLGGPEPYFCCILILWGFGGCSSHRSYTTLETNLASRWEGVRLPRASGKSLDFPGSSPNFHGSSSATSPEVLRLWNLTAIQRFPGSFPNFPGSSPNFPRSFPDFPGGQPFSLGRLTPSPDSQKLSLSLSNPPICAIPLYFPDHAPRPPPHPSESSSLSPPARRERNKQGAGGGWFKGVAQEFTLETTRTTDTTRTTRSNFVNHPLSK